MRIARGLLTCALSVCSVAPSWAQDRPVVPKTIAAGSAFSVQIGGSGQGTLYVIGPEQIVKQDVQLGSKVEIAAGTLYNAGHYLVFVKGWGETSSMDVTPALKPANLSFIARPSRLPVGLKNGITGAVYLFDSYQNLITAPTTVAFQLSTPSGPVQGRSSLTRNGSAWLAMDSSPKEGSAQFVASVGEISATRVIGQVPGDPCGLQMTAKPAGKNVSLETALVRDCSGNAVPDGTIVTFTATYGGAQTTVDVPLKRGVATVEMPAHQGAVITVASGVVLGNQIRWMK